MNEGFCLFNMHICLNFYIVLFDVYETCRLWMLIGLSREMLGVVLWSSGSCLFRTPFIPASPLVGETEAPAWNATRQPLSCLGSFCSLTSLFSFFVPGFLVSSTLLCEELKYN